MQSDIPKQYLSIQEKSILEHTLDCFVNHASISGVVVSVSKEDKRWPDIVAKYPDIKSTEGGAERFQSVLNGLRYLTELANGNDWVLVHDAARPCLRQSDLEKLISELSSHDVGGLLGLPMADTVKRCNDQDTVNETVPRYDLWRALTPQMFRFATLKKALEQSLADNALVTDEASAIERLGLRPKMVAGHSDNIKVTRPEDLELAQLYLAARNS